MVETSRVDRVREKARQARDRGREIGRCARLDTPWARCRTARLARETILQAIFAPAMAIYMRLRTEGRRRTFRGLQPPVIFVANHSSHIDTPTILRALPRAWRQRTAVGAAADYFYRNRLVAAAVSLVFNTVPIQRDGGGLDIESTTHLHSLLRQRWNLLLYPEGTRSRNGAIGRLRSGAAVLAADHGIAIVPIYVEGTRETMPPGRSWPRRLRGRTRSRRHRVKVRFGPPIRPLPGEHRNQLIARVQAFYDAQGGNGAPQRLPLAVADDARVEQPARAA